MGPVAGGIIPAELQPLLVSGIGDLPAQVPAEWGISDAVMFWVGRIIPAHLICGPHGKSIVVLGDEDHVAASRILCQGHPIVGVEFHWVELLIEVVVNITGNLLMLLTALDAVLASPADFRPTDADRPPVDEEPKFGVTKPLHLLR